MKKIAIVTTTRAEFGLLLPVINELRKYENDDFKMEIIVSGTHLSDEYGHTVDEIIRSNVRIDHRIKIPVKSAFAEDISVNQAEALVQFTKLFVAQCYDAVVVLGDRYEMLAIAVAAGNTHTPIFHLCGGDTTEGAMDEWIRHSITKMSYLHFVTNQESRKRVIQLGESPDRVFKYGSTSIDNVLKCSNMPLKEALGSLGLEGVAQYAICTYHPVTMEGESVERQIADFLTAINEFPQIQFIVTKSNADQGGARINELLDKANEDMSNLHVFFSLGVVRYLSLMRYAKFVLGNSSSGIVETPALGIPTVNIGDRQKGRLQAESIINCRDDAKSIIEAIHKVLNSEFCEKCRQVVSPYGDGHAAEKIAKKAVEVVLDGKINLKKKFFDIREDA